MNSTDHHAFLWRRGVMTDLGVVGTHPCSTAVAVNAKGQVIGNTGICGVGGGPGFLSENGGQMVDLNSLVRFPIPGLMIGDVAFINDRGEIAAKGRLANGIRHDLLLIPCDLDHSDNKDCQDGAEGDSIVNQSNLAPVTQSLVGDSEDGSEAGSNTRSNRRFRIPGNRSSSKK